MRTNNFDQSSSGVNIELSAFYDMDLSRFWFDETFHILQYSGYRQNSVLVYGMNMLDVSDFDFSDHNNYNIPNSKALILAYLKYQNLTGYEEIRDCLQYIGTSSDTIADLCLGLTSELTESDLADFLQENFDHKFTTVISRGYNQGDYSEIIIPEKVIAEFPDQTLETIGDYLQDDIDHLLWDSPIYARLEIDGLSEEIYLEENLKNPYEWDRDSVIEFCKQGTDRTLNKSQYKTVMSYLRENLPNELDYQ